MQLQRPPETDRLMSFSFGAAYSKGQVSRMERVKLAMTGGHVTVIIEHELLPHLQVALQSHHSALPVLSAVS